MDGRATTDTARIGRHALRDLEFRARTTVEGVRQGLHRSPFHGFSAEFSQYRAYRPGDDLKHVDWKVFAKSDRLYTRQFRETTDMGVLVLLDGSASMAFPAGRSKLHLAQTVAAAMVLLIAEQGDAVGLMTLAPRSVLLPPRSGRHHHRAVAAAIAAVEPGGDGSIATTVRRARAVLRRRGAVLVVSDFYDDEATFTELRRLAVQGHDIVLFHVVSPEEQRLETMTTGEFVDLETDARLSIDPGQAAEAYDATFAAFVESVERRAGREGYGYARFVTAEAIEPALRRFLVTRRPA